MRTTSVSWLAVIPFLFVINACTGGGGHKGKAFTGTWIEEPGNITVQVVTDGTRFKVTETSSGGFTTYVYDGELLHKYSNKESWFTGAGHSNQISAPPRNEGPEPELLPIKFWEISDLARKIHDVKDVPGEEEICGRKAKKVQVSAAGFTLNYLVDTETDVVLRDDGLSRASCQSITYGVPDSTQFTRPW